MMNIYQHFREDEQDFIDQVIDWAAQVENQYAPYLSNFLNPRQLFIVQAVVGQYKEIEFEAFGGNENSEQRRVLIYPPYFEPTTADFEIALIEINYPTKFSELAHGQILGSILGAGISRDTLGDIINADERWQFFIDRKMKDFIFMNVDRIGRTNVQLEEQPLENQVEMTDKWEIDEVVVSSLRLDVVLARALNLSRNRAKTLINDKRIKINWIEIERPDIDVEEHDIISIRGHGRVQIRERLGTTRKDNIVLEIGKINRNS
jgi:RNA-binding protein YlmH